jgi:hypothetical protein
MIVLYSRTILIVMEKGKNLRIKGATTRIHFTFTAGLIDVLCNYKLLGPEKKKTMCIKVASYLRPQSIHKSHHLIGHGYCASIKLIGTLR